MEFKRYRKNIAFNIIQLLVLVVLTMLLDSCVGHKDVVYLRSGKSTHKVYELDSINLYKIQPGDKIGLQVLSSSSSGEQLDVFNKQVTESSQGGGVPGQGGGLTGYNVDAEGNIDIPMVGKLLVKDLTIEQIDSLIEIKLQDYITFSYAKTVLMNYRVTMLGEFRQPKTISNNFNTINLLQAIGEAGDFTELANKSRVKVYRKVGNSYEMYMLNLSNDGFFKNQYFQLMPNDIVYAEPLKAKIVKINTSTITITITVITFFLVLSNYIK